MKTITFKCPFGGEDITIEFVEPKDVVIKSATAHSWLNGEHRASWWRPETFDEYMEEELKLFEKDFKII